MGMLLHTILFYAFAAVLIGAACGVVFARNPVHAVMFLVLAFFQSALLWMLAEAEFLAIVLVLVYVGAVMVLFLFVVMMLDINFTELREGFLNYLPVGALVGLILVVELLMVLGGWVFSSDAASVSAVPIVPGGHVTNTEAIGQVVYTHYFYLFQAAGMVLLVAMIGAIVLTMRQRVGVRKQRIGQQVSRRSEETLEVKDVPTGSGV